jgi:predicted ATPase
VHPDRIARRLTRLEGAGSRQPRPGQVSGSTRRHRNNLPLEISSFVGRERETMEIQRLLSGTRLLTLTGTGGVGKSRLALHVAGEVLDRFADGARLVDLASLTDPMLVGQTVATALGVREEPHHPFEVTLSGFLRRQEMLLILDNLEHLLVAAGRLVEVLLSSSPGLRILATSRQPLGIAGEIAWRVPSLGVPATQLPPDGFDEQVLVADAVQLFVERARAVTSNFAIRPRIARAIGELCRRLDGIPLAIELAAARVPVLAPDELVARLDDRFRLLTSGSATALPRQQTLRGALDWSHELLDEREQVLFRRLAVFAGGWTLELAEALCVGDAADIQTGLDTSEILDLLASLVSQSRVVSEPPPAGTSVRHSLLETVRAYAAERLRAAGEEAQLQRRHRDWFLGWARQAVPYLQGVDQATWVARVEAEHDNLRAALERAASDLDATEVGLQAAVGIERFWSVRGYATEGRRWLRVLLAKAGPTPTPAGVEALRNAAVLALNQGDYVAARALVDQSVALARELASPGVLVKPLAFQALVAANQDARRAAAPADESVGMARTVDDRAGLLRALHTRAVIARLQRDFAPARLYKAPYALRDAYGRPAMNGRPPTS